MAKYRNQKTEVDGIVFDSKREAERYRELKVMEAAGHIKSLKLQQTYQLVEGVKIEGEARKRPPIRYVADFVYYERTSDPERPWREVIEDVKGIITPAFRLKQHLMAIILHRHIRIVK